MHAARKMLVVLVDSDSTHRSCRWNPSWLGICQAKQGGLATSHVSAVWLLVLGFLPQLMLFAFTLYKFHARQEFCLPGLLIALCSALAMYSRRPGYFDLAG